MSSYSNGHPAATILPPAIKVITGASLVHRRLDKRQRAIMAADILDGQVTFTPSMKQLAELFGVNVVYITIARGLSPGKRVAILRGWDSTSFADLVRPRQLKLPMCASITNQQLEHVIRAVGVERALAAAIAVEHCT
jgi:hypothetical protein